MDTVLMDEVLERYNPARRRLIRMGRPLRLGQKRFANDRVLLSPAILYADTFNSKTSVAYELFREGIELGEIIPHETLVLCASSGNTGLGIAQICKAARQPCEIVMQSDTPDSKIASIATLGAPVSYHTIPSGTVAYAREKGRQPGCWDSDQYGKLGNVKGQRDYMAPQLWRANDDRIDVLVTAGGTLGTAEGARQYAYNHGRSTTIVVGICAGDEEVPGARNRARIARDVTIASLEKFEQVIEVTRHQSFLASYALFSEIDWTPGGPTSGLSLFAALRFLVNHKAAGTLDRFRGPDGFVKLVFICPDDFRPYVSLYKGELKAEELGQQVIDLDALLRAP